MSFYWNDGGRASAGFAGLCGDCVARSIAIGTGRAYRAVYDDLKTLAEKSPRSGVSVDVAQTYLRDAGWTFEPFVTPEFVPESFPRGTHIVHLTHVDFRHRGHYSCVVDGIVHDTWNPDYFKTF